MEHVIGQFGEHRLLSFDADGLTGAPTVEVAHEALLTAWTELAGWIDESRDDLRRHTSLTVALREWQLAGEHPDYLMTASRLAEYDDWSRSSTMTLTSVEQAFIDAGFARRDEERASEALRQRDEARSRRRLWGLVVALAASLTIAALFLLGVFDRGDGAKVAFFGVREDGSWNANIAAGLDRAERDLDLQLLDAPPIVDPPAEFRELAETGPDIIISDSLPTYTAPEVFDDFPDIRFGVVDGVVDSPNTTYVSFANEEGAFLAGAAAAMKTETGVIGFIGGTPGVVDDFRAGFEAGANWIDPDVEVLATYVAQPFVDQLGWVQGFVRADLGHDRAAALYERGADVVFHAAGYSGWGLFDAVVEQSEATGSHLWAIGVDNDQWFDVDELQQERILTSVIKRGDTAAFELLTLMMNDEGGVLRREVGLADDAFAYSTQGGRLTPDMVGTLDRAISEISTNRLQVPVVTSGPVLTLDPSQKALEAGLEGLTLADVREFLDGFVFPDHEEEFGSTCTGRDAEADMACSTLLTELADQWRARR
jgi:basic membrane protein A